MNNEHFCRLQCVMIQINPCCYIRNDQRLIIVTKSPLLIFSVTLTALHIFYEFLCGVWGWGGVGGGGGGVGVGWGGVGGGGGGIILRPDCC